MSDKPLLSRSFATANPSGWGPFYGLREGSGTASIDDSPTATSPLLLSGSAAWASKTHGPEVRANAAGDYLRAADAAGLHRPKTAFTVAVGLTPSGTWTYTATGPTIAGKMLWYSQVGYGIHSNGAAGNRARAVLTLGGTTYYTQDTPDTTLTNGTAYLLVARWQSGMHLNLRVYDRATATLLAEVTGTTSSATSAVSDAVPQSGVIIHDGRRFLAGRHENSDGTGIDYAFGDYEFVAVSNERLSDSEVAAFVADPWADYPASASDYALRGPSTGVPGIATTAFTVTLNYGVNPVSPVTITPTVTGMTATCSPTTVALSAGTRSATFTATIAEATTNGTIGTVAVANSGSLANPAALPFTAVTNEEVIVSAVAPDLLAALVTYLRTSPTVAAKFPGDGDDPVYVFTGKAKAGAQPPFLVVKNYREIRPGRTIHDMDVMLSIVVVTNDGLDTAAEIGRAVKNAVDTEVFNPDAIGRQPFTWGVGNSERGLTRTSTAFPEQIGIGKGGKYVFAEQIDYTFWVNPS